METEVRPGKGSDDDTMWGSDDVVGCDDEHKDVEAGMAAKMWDEEEAMVGFEYTSLTLGLGIALYYRTVLGSPSSTEWVGKFGIVSHICDMFRLNQHTRRMVKRILQYGVSTTI